MSFYLIHRHLHSDHDMVMWLQEDDGLESKAICQCKYVGKGRALIPTELKAKAIFEQAASVEKDNFDVLAAKAVYKKVFKP